MPWWDCGLFGYHLSSGDPQSLSIICVRTSGIEQTPSASSRQKAVLIGPTSWPNLLGGWLPEESVQMSPSTSLVESQRTSAWRRWRKTFYAASPAAFVFGMVAGNVAKLPVGNLNNFAPSFFASRTVVGHVDRVQGNAAG